MATDTQRLIVSLEATTKKFEAALNRANGVATRRARSIETRFNRMNAVVSSSFARLGAVLASGVALRGAQQLIDASTRIENALKVAGLAGDDLVAVYDRLFVSAQRNAAPIESLVELYSRAALVQNELGVSTEELLQFTDNIAVALRVSGKSAQEASGALLQLSQALGSGIVRAEEFNSLLENAQPIAQAAAAGLEEAGGSVAKLRQLVIDGEVSSQAFFRAFEAGSVTLQNKVAGAQFTVAQGFTQVRNALVKAAGQFDEATGVSDRLSAALSNLAESIMMLGEWSERVANGPLGRFFSLLAALDSKAQDLLGTLSRFTLNDELFSALNNAIAPHQALTEDMIRAYASETYGAGAAPKTSRVTAPSSPSVMPVSLSDFTVPDSDSGSGSTLNEYQQATQAVQQRTAALLAETQAMAGLNPLVGDYGAAVLKAKTALELEQAAREAGLEITPELAASIDELADKYVDASVAVEMLAESQDAARETAEELAGVAKDVMGGFISDLREGTDAVEALQGALDKVLDKLIDIALNTALDGITGGILGSLGGGGSQLSIASGGGVGLYASGGISRKPAIFGEAGPEAAVPLPDGRRIPVDLRMPSIPSTGGASGRVQIALGPGLEADILDQAGQQSVEIVTQAAPPTVSAAVGQTAKGLGRGDMDPIFRNRFGMRPQRIRRG